MAELEEIELLARLENLLAGFVFSLVISLRQNAIVERVLMIDFEDFVAKLFCRERHADSGVVFAFALKQDGAGVDGGIAGGVIAVG